MSAPESAAILAASADASSRSMSGNSTARKRLRDDAERTGYPSEKYALPFKIAQFCSGSLPNPMPGSRIMQSGYEAQSLRITPSAITMTMTTPAEPQKRYSFLFSAF